MKVLVLNPPTDGQRFSRDGRCQSDEDTWLDTFPPTTLASIAGCVREMHDTALLDCIGGRIPIEECLEKARRFKPDFCIVNTSTPTINWDMHMAGRIKKETNAKIIVYGEHATSCYKRLLEEYEHVDFAVLGEPETPIMRILAGDTKTRGVATREYSGGLWQEPDLDALPFPAYDLLPAYYYPLTGERWMFVRNGRGCPYACTYCVMPKLSGRNIRYHSVDYMIRQIKWLVRDMNIRLFMLWDELATFDKKRMLHFCEMMVQEGLHRKCRWFCTTRVDCFDAELAAKMKKAGCDMVTFGMESGSQKVLDANKKGITIGQSIAAVKAAKLCGLKTIGHFVIGLPSSSPETEEETTKLAINTGIDFAQFYIATPFPASAFYDQAMENGWLVDSNWEHVEQGTAVVSYPNFTADEIRECKKQSYLRFYLRPKALLSLAMSITPWTVLKIPRYCTRFFRWATK